MVYLVFVRIGVKHIVLGVLLAGYLVLTFGGHHQVLASILKSMGEPQQVTAAKKFPPNDSRPIWVLKKHLLSSTKKVEPPTVAELPVDDISSTSVFITLQFPAGPTVRVQSDYLPYRPRDPPLV